MNSSENHITYTTKSRYYTLGEPSDGKTLLLVLHGYGYLAKYFINKFNQLDLDKYVVVCPEAPHRFYQNGTNGRVGASWMTKEDRTTDIENYIEYLSTLVTHLKSQNDYSDSILLGFSQGGATASRFMAFSKHDFDKFILWATVFPPDMSPSYFDQFSASKNYFVFGDNDQFYTQEKIEEHFNDLKKLNLPFQMINFEGKHDIHQDSLLHILND